MGRRRLESDDVTAQARGGSGIAGRLTTTAQAEVDDTARQRGEGGAGVEAGGEEHSRVEPSAVAFVSGAGTMVFAFIV